MAAIAFIPIGSTGGARLGVTIHYSGQLRSPDKLRALTAFAEELATDLHWGFERIQNGTNVYPQGFTAYPHEDCEPLRFEFGHDMKARSWVKTQFAGPEVHVGVVKFLRQIRPLIGRLGVRDEGEYWETGSEEKLHNHMDTINLIIKQMKDEKPNIQVKVHQSDGRIVDVIG
jgi:hypothetical protein